MGKKSKNKIQESTNKNREIPDEWGIVDEGLSERQLYKYFDKFSNYYLSFEKKIDQMLKGMSDQHLSLLLSYLKKEREKPFTDTLDLFINSIKFKQGLRWHHRNAVTISANVYCLYHACDTKNCPPGEHVD